MICLIKTITLKFTDRIEWVVDNVKGNMIKIVETNYHDSKRN